MENRLIRPKSGGNGLEIYDAYQRVAQVKCYRTIGHEGVSQPTRFCYCT